MRDKNADMAQQAEHVLGKDEVTGSNPVISSSGQSPQMNAHPQCGGAFCFTPALLRKMFSAGVRPAFLCKIFLNILCACFE